MTAMPSSEWGSEQDWRSLAACRSEDTVIFFPSPAVPMGRPTTYRGPDPYAAARVVCRRCDVSLECLMFALDNRQDDGMWGGKDEDERRRILRTRREARRLGL